MAWLKKVCSSKCEEEITKLPPDSYTHEEYCPRSLTERWVPQPLPARLAGFQGGFCPRDPHSHSVSPLLYGETPEVAKRDKGCPGEKETEIKSQSPLDEVPYTEQPEGMQSALEAWPGCFLRGGGMWDRLGQACFRKKPSHGGYTCVCSSAAGVGVGGGVGSGVLQQEEEVGLGDGVEKGEVLHQAWALEAKASRASRPCPSPRWLPHGSGLHTHTLQDSESATSLLKPVGSLAWSSLLG